MTKTTVASLAAAAAALLASCASTPRAQPLTIEIFDSRAVAAVAPAALVSPTDLSLPDVPAPTVSAAPVAARLPRAGNPALDAGLSFPPRPRSRVSFALAAPPAPAVHAVPAAVVPAAKPAPQPKKPAAPAAAAALPAPPAGAAALPASAPAGAAAGTAPAADASPVPYGRLREIYARQGDVLQVGLDGVGFLFLGLADAQASGDCVQDQGEPEQQDMVHVPGPEDGNVRPRFSETGQLVRGRPPRKPFVSTWSRTRTSTPPSPSSRAPTLHRPRRRANRPTLHSR